VRGIFRFAGGIQPVRKHPCRLVGCRLVGTGRRHRIEHNLLRGGGASSKGRPLLLAPRLCRPEAVRRIQKANRGRIPRSQGTNLRRCATPELHKVAHVVKHLSAPGPPRLLRSSCTRQCALTGAGEAVFKFVRVQYMYQGGGVCCPRIGENSCIFPKPGLFLFCGTVPVTNTF